MLLLDSFYYYYRKCSKPTGNRALFLKHKIVRIWMVSRGVFIVVCAWNINNHTVFPYSVWSCFSPVERALGRWIFRQGSAMASLQLRSRLVRHLLHSSHPTIKIETGLELELCKIRSTQLLSLLSLLVVSKIENI